MQMSKPSSLELKVPPALVFLIALGGIFLTEQFIPFDEFLGEYARMVSYILMSAALIFGISALVSFKRAKTTPHPIQIEKASTLVDSGVFRFSRNPMYLAMLLLTLAFAARLDNPVALLWALAFHQYISRFQIAAEERMLTKLFGDAYIDYCSRVRRWL